MATSTSPYKIGWRRQFVTLEIMVFAQGFRILSSDFVWFWLMLGKQKKFHLQGGAVWADGYKM